MYTETCVAPVDASLDFLFYFSPNEHCEGWRGGALPDFFLLFSFPRPVPRQLAHSQHLGLTWYLLAGFLPISAAASIYLCKPPYVIVGSAPSLSCHAIAYLLRSLPTVRRHRASSAQGSSSNGCFLFAGHHRPINVRVLFSHTHHWYEVYNKYRTTTLSFLSAVCRTHLRTSEGMCVCLYSHHIHIARVWINRVRLPILLVVSRTGKNNTRVLIFLWPCLRLRILSRETGSAVPSRVSIAVRFLTCHHELDVLYQFIMLEFNQSSKQAET